MLVPFGPGVGLGVRSFGVSSRDLDFRPEEMNTW